MSLKRPAKDQPENFEFNSSSLEAANKIFQNILRKTTKCGHGIVIYSPKAK